MNKGREISLYNLVTQSNKLIESKYNLNITEQRLVLAMISVINPDDDDFREYQIKVSDLSKVLKLKNKNIYNDVKNITESLMTKVIKIKKPNGILQINWISSASYDDNLGIVTLKFDPSLKPYLLNIKENYTSTRFGITAKFKSFYTTRIYLLVKQYEKIGKRVVLIDFLRELFPQYELYKDIKRRILLPAQKEICDNSDIKFSINERKIGKKVEEIIFYDIKSQSYMQELPLFPPPIKKEESLAEIINRKYNVDLSVAEKLLAKLDMKNKEAEFKKIFKYIDSSIMSKNIKNLPGFVVDCIRKKYYEETKKDDSVDNILPFFPNEVKAKKELNINNKNIFFIKLMNALRKDSEEEIYNRWLSKLNFVEKKKSNLVLTVETKFLRDWISKEYSSIILTAATSIDNSINTINITNIIE